MEIKAWKTDIQKFQTELKGYSMYYTEAGVINFSLLAERDIWQAYFDIKFSAKLHDKVW